MNEPVAYLRDAQPDAEDEALVVCAKGDNGCFPVYVGPSKPKSADEIVTIIREWLDSDDPTQWGEFETGLDAAVERAALDGS